MTDLLRVHHFEPMSVVNGPGRRCVLWLQGCTLGCPGCFNPQTHSKSTGASTAVVEVLKLIQATEGNVQGLSVSGGEPLQQAEALLLLLSKVRKQTTLSVLLFTGYSETELHQFPQWPELKKKIDVVIAGRYEQSQRQATNLIGSLNKSVRFYSDRYCRDDLNQIPPAEIVVGANGDVMLSGIDPLEWNVK